MLLLDFKGNWMEKKSGRWCIFLIFCVVYPSWDFLHSPSKDINECVLFFICLNENFLPKSNLGLVSINIKGVKVIIIC